MQPSVSRNRFNGVLAGRPRGLGIYGGSVMSSVAAEGEREVTRRRTIPSRSREGVDLRVVVAALGAFVILRLFSAALMTWAALHPVLDQDVQHGAAARRRGPMSAYWNIASGWDGRWFRHIAGSGYPAVLPMHDGQVLRNPWAFLPAYPMAVRATIRTLGLTFPVAGGIVSLAAAAAVVVLLVALLQPRIGRFGAFAVTVLLMAYPASPVLQMTYSDAFGLLVLVAVLFALDRQRWLLAGGLMIVAGLTRPITAPLLVVVLVVVLARWLPRSGHRPDRAESLRMAALVIASIAGVLVWPLIAWWRTGVRSAYSRSELAWHPGGSLQPFLAWLDLLHDWLAAPWDEVALGLIGLGYVALVLSPLAARLGTALRAWCVAYAGYLGVAGGYVSSHVRFALLLFPLAAILTGVAARRRPPLWWRTGAVVVSAVALLSLQVWWILDLLRPIAVQQPI